MSIDQMKFENGELYLFHPSDPKCDPNHSIWGMVDHVTENTIYLESSSTDLRTFKHWHQLPEGNKHCRLASRTELRDYIANIIMYESRI